ncbi:hypothetical protein HPC49_13110 [Pyxidicoccus fallax]|uniref:FtsH ternary system domain-containing protein n=1 Tax=Pyxidicoccus fallax TaxID=394095 RepID=A0A848LDQ5_9BACT|nr:hypothetical protein [Pyxidicoccus fallax]NMO17220.1 hypothetical protein [Pyxidicoccus fallax]NPC79174.1 hypothetical protein [Pyxidicoccus fallax]
MTQVSLAEHSLLTLARAIVGLGQYASVEDLLRDRHTVPDRLSPGAMRVLQDTLAKGSVLALARCGGWKQRRYLDGGQERSGRLWQRHAPPALHFSPRTFLTLRWMLEQPLVKHGCMPLPAEGTPTAADELFLYLCCRLVAGTPCAQAVGEQALFRGSALCWLGFPDLLGAKPPALSAANFTPLLADGGWLLEALREDLARRWRQLEESKRFILEPAALVALGTAQEAVLSLLLDAVDAAGRRDLAGFLLAAGRPLLEQPAAHWVAGLSPSASLGQRAQAARASGAFLRTLGRLARWDADHRAVRFFDDDYDAAQLLLSEWSAFGEAGFRRAADLERELSTSLTTSSAIPATLPPPSAESAP